MGPRYPLNWLVGLLLVVCLGVLFAVMLIYLGFAMLIRRLWWTRELARRRGLQHIAAEIIERTRITEAGHCRYVVRVTPRTDDPYRAAPLSFSFRAVLCLSKKERIRARKLGTLPVLFDPRTPKTLILDRAALGDVAGERAEYIKRGNTVWTAL